MVDGVALGAVVATIPVVPGAEITVECNPDNVSVDLLRSYVDAGVNRVSLGVQSMATHVLGTLGRQHDQRNVERAVDAIRTVGLPTFNLDVIYGAAGESVADWEHTVRSIVQLEPPHVSAYALTVEAGNPTGRTTGSTSRRRRPGPTSTKLGRRPARSRRVAELRDLELGPARPRVPSQRAVLAAARLPGFRLRRPLTQRRPPLVERANARPLHRPGRSGGVDRGCRRDARRGDHVGSNVWNCCCGCPAGVPLDALDGDQLPGLVERHADRWVLTRAGRPDGQRDQYSPDLIQS